MKTFAHVNVTKDLQSVSKQAHHCQQPLCFQTYHYLAEIKPVFACMNVGVYIYIYIISFTSYIHICISLDTRGMENTQNK